MQAGPTCRLYRTFCRRSSRLTRLKIKTLKILCNGCNDNFDQLTAVRELITTLKSELLNKIDLLNTKICQLETRSNSQSSIMSPKTLDEVTSEAVERINRSKNLLIKGIPVPIGDVSTRKRKDTTEVMKALTVINEHVPVPASIVRLGPVPKNGDRPRYIKVTFTDLNTVRSLLRHKSKLLDDDSTCSIKICDDKTKNTLNYLT